MNADTAIRVTVVVPARNAAAHLDECLTSLKAQDFECHDLDIVVVDNGSTDDTAAMAHRATVRVVSEPRRGFGFARNAGAHAAHGDLIVFIDSDCRADTDWLARLVAGFDDPDVGCVVGTVRGKDAAGLIPRWFEQREFTKQERLLALRPPVVAGANMAYRRDVFEAIGWFDEDCPSGEDGDFFWRLVRSDRFRVRYQRDAIVRHAHPRSAISLMRRAFVEGRGLARFRHKYRRDLPSPMDSFPRALWGYAKVFTGVMACPFHMLRTPGNDRSVRERIAWPLLDKAYSLARETGHVVEFIQVRTQGERADV